MQEINVLPNGSMLYVEDNEAGGRTYYTDENGVMSTVWDTCLTDLHTLMQAVEYELRIQNLESKNK